MCVNGQEDGHPSEGERWEEFRKVCLLRESLRYLSLGHISKVVCLWSRHPREFEATMSCVVVEDMLANISAETPSKLLTCWLTGHLIPVIVRQCPAALSTLVSWLEQRARNLEILEKDDWPHNALHLCDLPVLQQFTSGDCDLRIASEILKEQLDDPAGAFKRLAALILHLRVFIRFCSQYNCHLSFTEYLQETTETVAYRMLDRITATELIPDFIAKTIRPYMAEHGLDDRILYQYVKSLTEWSFKMSLQLQETIWEVKAISIIGCIQNHNYKMDAILDVILKACIPWSTAMEELIKDGLGMKHPSQPLFYPVSYAIPDTMGF
ncbi:Kinetochore-associated protein 1 [Lamellibrachia satsuma]|nr:Kinetochore-associated protein 1 [Lamellibrachia satsuma]